MRTYDAHQTRHLLADWPQKVARAVGAPNFDAVLPRGAVTLIELADADDKAPHPWLTAVVPAVVDLITSGSPVLYVESGGPEAGDPLADYVTDFCNDVLLGTHLDRKPRKSESGVLITSECGREGCPDPLVGLCDRCCVPTLVNIRRQLQAHDAARGPSIVLLDQVETMRPYFEMTYSSAAWITKDSAEACGRRADDLLTFAESRPTATVAVSGQQGPGGAPEALRAVSRLHIIVSTPAADEHAQVVVAHRSDLCEDWETAVLETDKHVLAWRNEKWRGGYK